jgi:hypothetical protein
LAGEQGELWLTAGVEGIDHDLKAGQRAGGIAGTPSLNGMACYPFGILN